MSLGAVALTIAVLAPALDAAKAEAAAAEATSLHADGKLDEASNALARAYEIYPDRDYLYMRGIIEREAGHCDVAVELFEAFLAESPPLVDVEATQAELKKCGSTLSKPEPAPPPPPPPVVEAPPPRDVVPREPAPAQPRPWWRDPLGGGLFGSGIVLAAVGGALLGTGAARARSSMNASTAGDFRTDFATARGLNVAGFVVLGVGTALVVGGVTRWAVVARRRHDDAID